MYIISLIIYLLNNYNHNAVNISDIKNIVKNNLIYNIFVIFYFLLKSPFYKKFIFLSVYKYF